MHRCSTAHPLQPSEVPKTRVSSELQLSLDVRIPGTVQGSYTHARSHARAHTQIYIHTLCYYWGWEIFSVQPVFCKHDHKGRSNCKKQNRSLFRPFNACKTSEHAKGGVGGLPCHKV